MLDYVDATAGKIVLAASDGDSVRRIVQKIDGTYSWVYAWIERLEAIGVVERSEGIRVTAPAVREGYSELLEATVVVFLVVSESRLSARGNHLSG